MSAAAAAEAVVLDITDAIELEHDNPPGHIRLLLSADTARETYRALKAWYSGELV